MDSVVQPRSRMLRQAAIAGRAGRIVALTILVAFGFGVMGWLATKDTSSPRRGVEVIRPYDPLP
ncbi:hypothetical protein [Paracraurococcus lichenis]|uniref:Conjugal transfer protein TrbI n=1 Tax=Paracraurococcus lichenis TaxID=3064888 RepID=A0ABT9EB61_9PROT|nr:hypothetical protein [Paracraurococcus sp. LOR1-02]MDO9713447.1 hypothetical protein [Paracraurococcus sp. LOR1-02]